VLRGGIGSDVGPCMLGKEEDEVGRVTGAHSCG